MKTSKTGGWGGGDSGIAGIHNMGQGGRGNVIMGQKGIDSNEKRFETIE